MASVFFSNYFIPNFDELYHNDILMFKASYMLFRMHLNQTFKKWFYFYFILIHI